MKPVESSPDMMGGSLVFTGTRVPAETLIDYLEAGDSIDEFLSDFPTVSREQVIEALAIMKGGLVGAVGQTPRIQSQRHRLAKPGVDDPSGLNPPRR